MSRKNKARNNGRHQEELEFLTKAIYKNGATILEGPKKKRWSKHDFASVRPLTSTQEEMFQSFYQGQHICAHGSAGTGKAQPLNAKILTPYGWTTMEDVTVGDKVITPSGDISTITHVFPQGKKDIFTIIFHDGSSTRCCDEHLWEVWYAKKKGTKTERHVLSTLDVIDLLDEGVNVSIPIIQSYSYPNVELPMSPYLLGVLIGDGCITNQIMFSTADEQILSHVQRELLPGYTISDKTSSAFDYRIVCKDKSIHNTTKGVINNAYKQILTKLNLFGCKSDTKFIPEEYKHAGVQQRLELIRGLMDTDGTVNINKRGGRGISYTTVSKQLAEDLQSLLWSIGATCSITSRTPTYTYNNKKMRGEITYTLFVSHPTPKILFSLTRKQDRCLDRFNNGRTTLRRRITSINQSSVEEAQCIMIDHPDHLYITDDYIVTHNTFLALYLALTEICSGRGGQKRIIIVRSVVPTREVGYLPGTLDEKIQMYQIPYMDIISELTENWKGYEHMKEAGLIEFITTSFVRGLTWDNAFIIIDEFQNMTISEIDSVITRVGYNSRVIACGDTNAQCDLKREQTGSKLFVQIISAMNDFSIIHFLSHDIVRSEFVKHWIQTKERFT